ncbi:MAG TPA: hypothetical protein DCL61_08620 [Cyanobacteria bacterium UBA12227]|nr:hypothetical protein [Cyanobacteria bacterium UBA12227]HAX88193.1 hypothetical protein [Cyanobacteria bacterium UBA11370]HBY76186.1 hypothetical protein [Cyanobacteria bacterium UBA11148]
MKPLYTLIPSAAIITTAILCGISLKSEAATLGDSTVFTKIPTPPGFPEGIAVSGDRVYVCGPATFGNFQQSSVLAYSLSGTLVQQYPIQNQNLAQPHALAGCTFNEKDILYAVDTQQGIIRFNVNQLGMQEVYAAALPDLPTCSSVPAGTPCSPTAIDRPPLPNDIRFDNNGYAYLSDSFQATIWRIPPGGGQPQIWFQNPLLDIDFGVNGIGIDAKTNELYFALTLDSFGQGSIYKLPLLDQPTGDNLTLFHQYSPGLAPDGIAFGESGKLYVALAGSNQISVLQPDGTESARYSGPAIDPNNPNQPLIWANPANIAFNDKTRSLLVTNHATLFPNPEPLFGVIEVFVDDEAAKVPEPSLVSGLLLTSLVAFSFRKKFTGNG